LDVVSSPAYIDEQTLNALELLFCLKCACLLFQVFMSLEIYKSCENSVCF